MRCVERHRYEGAGRLDIAERIAVMRDDRAAEFSLRYLLALNASFRSGTGEHPLVTGV